jgi:ABC-2 type transport system permease protein
MKLSSIHRRLSTYGAFVPMVIKTNMAYTSWFWVNLISQFIMLAIFVAFWRATYDTRSLIAGLTREQTLGYLSVTQLFWGVAPPMILRFGGLVKKGSIIVELLRPVDLQGVMYVHYMAGTLYFMLQRGLVVLLAWPWLGLQLPQGPRVWLLFATAALFSLTIQFLLQWLAAMSAFYTSETWGISVLLNGLSLIWGGAFLPVQMMPDWARTVFELLPFGQALYVPGAILSGLISAEDAPRACLLQALWIIGLVPLSRVAFNLAGRKVTVQGG